MSEIKEWLCPQCKKSASIYVPRWGKYGGFGLICLDCDEKNNISISEFNGNISLATKEIVTFLEKTNNNLDYDIYAIEKIIRKVFVPKERRNHE